MSDKNLVIFISPHYEKSGETYVLYELVNNLNNLDNINEYKILNTHNDFTDSKHIIDFPFKFKPELKFLTKYFPWLKYRIYMICISLIYIAVFPFFIKKLQRNYKKIIITTRMCVSAISLLKLLMFNKNFYLTSSFAGIPHTNYLRKLLWPHLFKSVDQIVIPSDDMKDRIFDYTKRNDVNILPNPVITNEMAEVRKFIPRSKDQLKNEFKIICVGRLTYQKGFDVLIKSLIKFNNISCDIMGNGDQQEKLQSLIFDNNLQSRIKLLGRVEKPWKKFYQYDFFVMPSRWEGPGHTVIEAMNIGLPSLVSNCEAGPKASVEYGECGYIFKNENVDDLIDKIFLIIKNYDEAIDKAKKGLISSKKYHSDVAALAWLNFYKKNFFC